MDYFATFGSSQLLTFNVNPMKVAVYIKNATEIELRDALNQHPFYNRYCTTYPMESYQHMADDYGVVLYEMDELLKKENK